jgi:hypothetical protein
MAVKVQPLLIGRSVLVSPGNLPGILVPSKVFFEYVFIIKRPVPQYDATDCLGYGHVYSLSFTAPPTICELERCTEWVRSLVLSGFGGRIQQVAMRCNWPGLACVHALSLSLCSERVTVSLRDAVKSLVFSATSGRYISASPAPSQH